MTVIKLKPRVAFMFLCDRHDIDLSGKINCFGIFNVFNVWAFPAFRDVSIIISLFNIFRDYNLKLNWGSSTEDKKLIGTAFVQKSPEPNGITRAIQRFRIPINKEGVHFLEVKIGNTAAQIPIIIHLEKWPKLSEKEIEKALKDPNSVKSARLEVICGKCKRIYIFEIHLDPNEKNAPGTYKFPDNGKFKCITDKCNNIILTKDFEGNARSLLGKTPSKRR